MISLSFTPSALQFSFLSVNPSCWTHEFHFDRTARCGTPNVRTLVVVWRFVNVVVFGSCVLASSSYGLEAPVTLY